MAGSQRNANIHTVSPIVANPANASNMSDAGCQTLSTGDIVIMKVYFKEDPDKGADRVVLSSPRRTTS